MKNFSQWLRVMLLVTSLMISGCTVKEDSQFYGEEINPAMFVNDFTLIDSNEEEFNFEELEGKIVVVAFLFTRCPDICPVVSANLDFVSNELGGLYEDQVAILSITVDPWTDNSSVLKQYAEERGLDWPHLTGSVDDLQPVWINFDVGLATYDSDIDGDKVADGFDICPDTPEGEPVDDNGCGLETQQSESGDVSVKHHPLTYWVDHTTGTIIVDKQMKQRVWWEDMDWNAELVIEDIITLLEE